MKQGPKTLETSMFHTKIIKHIGSPYEMRGEEAEDCVLDAEKDGYLTRQTMKGSADSARLAWGWAKFAAAQCLSRSHGLVLVLLADLACPRPKAWLQTQSWSV